MSKRPDFDPRTVPVRAAATVMLVRDHDVETYLEVFMLRRTHNAAFAGGMYVFPGGRVDDLDDAEEFEAISDGLSDAQASELLQIERGGLSFWVAAIRECFEEAGVLLARQVKTGEVIRFDDPTVAAYFEKARHLVHEGKLSLPELCASEGLMLATDSIHLVSHWVTPLGEQRRFDTRFFVARAPQAQDPLHDDSETIASLWVNPNHALAQHKRDELQMIFPTIKNLQFLLPHDSADSALDAASKVGTPPRIQPRLRFDENGRLMAIVMPDEAGYEELLSD